MWCLLVGVRYLLCVLCVECCWLLVILFEVFHCMFVVSWPVVAIGRRLSFVVCCCLLIGVCCWLLVVCCVLVVGCLLCVGWLFVVGSCLMLGFV